MAAPSQTEPRNAPRHNLPECRPLSEQLRCHSGVARAGKEADQDTSDYPSTTVIRREPRREAGEKRQRVDREVEQQPAEEAEPDDAEPDAENKHGGLRDKIVRSRLPPPPRRTSNRSFPDPKHD